MMRSIACLLFLLLAYPMGSVPNRAVQFREHTVATDLRGGYQVVAIDVNHDGRTDLIALASGMKELVWYENPGWQRHVIAGQLSRMINLAAWDVDGDGIPEIALAHEFSNNPGQSQGLVSWLKHKGDPKEPWEITEFDRLPTSHRLRWADIEGKGRKVLVNAPLAGSEARPPEFRDKVPLVFYRPGALKREKISTALEGVLHGILIYDWDQDKREDILTASFLGLDLFRFGKDGHWQQLHLASGNPDPWPKGGASEIAVGRLGKEKFLCSIEPWHGNQVVIYRQKRQTWERQVIDDALVDGHTLLVADLDRDGRDEILAGFRGKGQSVYLYSSDDANGLHWARRALDDGGIAAASCVAADLNHDGRIDLACIGSATANLKWYENIGPN